MDKYFLYMVTFLLLALFVGVYSQKNQVLGDNTKSQEVIQEKSENQDSKAEPLVNNMSSESKKIVSEPNLLEKAKTQPKAEELLKTSATVVTKKEKSYVTFKSSGLGEYKIDYLDGDTAFSVLLRAAATQGVPIGYRQYSFGKMITQIGSQKAEGTYYWALYHNGQYATLGAEELEVNVNDIIEWRYESWAN